MKQIIKYCLAIIFIFGINIDLYAQQRTISVEYKRNDDKSYDFYYRKKDPGSFLLNVKLSKLKNTQSSGYKGVVKGSYGKLFKLRPIHDNTSISFSYTSSYIRGVPNPKVDKAFVYALPFGKGKTVDVNELTNLGETYFGEAPPKNWKAYEFKLPSSDTVYAARKGLVVEIVNLYRADTLNTYNYTRKTNRILIEHSDGTLASYSGFMKDKIIVRKGQTIYPQTPLGILGRYDNRNTYSLRFSIYFLSNTNLGVKRKKNAPDPKSRYEYITPYFYTPEGKSNLIPGRKYTVDFNDVLLTHELSKREIKKLRKNKKSSGKGQ